MDDANFLQSPYVRTVPATVDAGGTETLTFHFLEPATLYWFGLKAFDSSGNGSPLSNVVMVQTRVGGPLGGRTGLAIALAPTRRGAPRRSTGSPRPMRKVRGRRSASTISWAAP